MSKENVRSRSMQEQIIRWRRNEIFCRYGDTFQATWQQLRAYCVDNKKPQYIRLREPRYVTMIQEALDDEGSLRSGIVAIVEKLADEEPVWHAWKYGDDSERLLRNTSTHIAIMEACHSAGMDYRENLAAIKLYAERNKLCHNDFFPLSAAKNWPGIAERLSKDRKDLSCVMPPDMRYQEKHILKMLTRIIHQWFDSSDSGLNNHTGWVRTQALREDAEKASKQSQKTFSLLHSTNTKEVVKEAHSEGIQRAKKRIQGSPEYLEFGRKAREKGLIEQSQLPEKTKDGEAEIDFGFCGLFDEGPDETDHEEELRRR